MICELLDTDAYPLVVIASLEDLPGAHCPAECACGGAAAKTFRVELHGSAPTAVKAVGLLSAIAQLATSDETSDDDSRMIRRSLAKLLEVTA